MAVAQEAPVFATVPLASVFESARNVRRTFDPASLAELTESIRAHGVLTPLLVREAGDRFEIAAGHRRYRAAQAAGLVEIPVLVRELDDAAFMEVLVLDNLQRDGVSPIEEAEGFQALMTFGFDLDALTKRLHRPRQYVYDRLRLLRVIPAAQALIARGLLTPAHGVLLSRLTPAQQEEATVPGEDGDAPFFTEDYALLYEDDAATEHARKADPYYGLHARTVRACANWITEHCRFAFDDPENAELFPDTMKAIEAAETVVHITSSSYLSPAVRDGGKVYGPNAWKRADGKQSSKTCTSGVTGVFVLGEGRGESLKVCIDKSCPTHWSAERREHQQQAKARTTAGASASAPKVDWEAQRKQEQAEQEAWVKAGPAVFKALAAGVQALRVDVVGAALIEELRKDDVTAARKLLGTPVTEEEILQFLLLVSLIDQGSFWQRVEFSKRMKKLLHVDVMAIVKQATAPKAESKKATPAPAKKATAKKGKKR